MIKPIPIFGARASQPILAQLRSLTSEHESEIHSQGMTVEFDIDEQLVGRSCSQSLAAAMNQVWETALEASEKGASLLITAVLTRKGIEVEFATSAVQPARNPEHVVAFGLSNANQNNGKPASAHDVYCARCPEGGLAWTLVERVRSATRAAA